MKKRKKKAMNKQPLKHNLALLRETKPRQRYIEGENLLEWRERAKEKLSELLGLDSFTPCEEKFNIEYKRETDSYTEYRFTRQSEEGYFFPAVLRIPKGDTRYMRNGKLPLIICLQGHSTGMHISLGEPKHEGDEQSISGGDRDFAVRAIGEGYAALALEQRCFGECGGREDGEPNCHISSHTALMLGRTTLGERVWDVSRVIDTVTEYFREIDPERICLMGNSGGGTATAYAAALDERIKMAMPSCAVCTWDRSIAIMEHCSCNFVPNIAKYFDMGDLCAMTAPRGLVIVNGKNDDIFLRDGVTECYSVAKAVYTAHGTPDRIAQVEGEGGHRFYADIGWAAFKRIAEDVFAE